MPCEKPLWLLISKDVESNEIKYSLCNAYENTPLDELAKMQSSRYWIAPSYGIGNACNAYFTLLSEKIRQNIQDFNYWGNMDTEIPQSIEKNR